MTLRAPVANWHVERFGRGSHQCDSHTAEFTNRLCHLCSVTGPCEHLAIERCDCDDPRPCADHTFEYAGGYLPWRPTSTSGNTSR